MSLRSVARALACLWAFAAVPSHAQQQLPPRRHTVAVDISTLPIETVERIDALTLEARLVLRLLQERFAVVAPSEEPDVLLAIEPSPGGVVLVARSTGEDEARRAEVALGTGTRAELQLEIAQRLVDLARAEFATLPPLEEERRLGPLVAVPEALPPTPRVPTRRPWIALDVGVDGLFRGNAVDPLAHASVTVGDRYFLLLQGGLLQVQESGVTTVPYDSATTEWQAQIGPGLRLWDSNRLSARTALLIGVVSHNWTLDEFGERVSESTRLDLLASIEAELRWRFAGPFGLGLRLAPGIAGRKREHERNRQVIFRREAARLEFGAFLAAEL